MYHLKIKMSEFKLEQLPNDKSYIAHEVSYVHFWNDISAYKRRIEKNKKDNNPVFFFTDGPPFVSGNLHPGHIAVMSFKDALVRYLNMCGILCEVKLGYDCHGLPAINKTADENNMSIEEFKSLSLVESNKLCEKMIFKYKNSWKPLIERIGRIVDFDNEYMTRDPEFMETCWWIFKQIYDQGNVYKGEKVMPYSYGNQTPLSNFEASQNYKEKRTKSIYIGFELVNDNNTDTDNTDEKTFFVAWTTTPWTLPMNLALCVNSDVIYVRFKVDNVTYIMGKNSVGNLFGKNTKIEIINEIRGSDLVGMKYKPLFSYTQKIDTKLGIDREYKIVSDSYVKESNIGSSIVHLAPAFGDDDFRVCSANGLIDNKTVSEYCQIDEYGRFNENIDMYTGLLVFESEDKIRADLKTMGNLLKIEMYVHNYPYCWRTNTPLIYRTNPSYYIRATSYRDKMLELNKTVNWNPPEIGERRFHDWLENIKDWSVSRSTSYATPIPIWKADDGSEICIGSISELETFTGQKITNLHPEYINDIVITKDDKIYKRITDTFDCWFESGAVPMAQLHYPFNPNSAQLETREYLADFICEGMDQTRGWFYTLMVLSTAIFDKAPYKNVVCTGMILDSEGNKFSKRLGNYVDPLDAINEFGSDVMRVYFINSPVMNADCLKYDNTNIERLKRRFTPYINGVKFWIEHTINFLKQNGKSDSGIDLSPNSDYNENIVLNNLMDVWFITRTDSLVANVKSSMDSYKFGNAIESLLDYIEDLTNWYIKFNRDRLKGLVSPKDWYESIYVLYNCLMVYIRLWAPFTPFLSEHIYQHLRYCSSQFNNNEYDSILLTDYPNPDLQIKFKVETNTRNIDILRIFGDLQRVCSIVRNLRDNTEKHTKRGIPLKLCTIYHDDQNYLNVLQKYIYLVQGELNCQHFDFRLLMGNVTIKIMPDKKMIGQFFKKEAGSVTKYIESQNEASLNDIFLGKAKLHYKTQNYDEIIDDKYYKLIRTPKGSVDNIDNNTSCKIDNDLMISINHTYDRDIHNAYQDKRLHSKVQEMRKKMNLRPWDKVSVILDSKYATPQMKLTLQNSLTNAIVIIADFTNDPTYENLVSCIENDQHIIMGMPFDIRPFMSVSDNKTDNTHNEIDGISKGNSGTLVIHYYKPK